MNIAPTTQEEHAGMIQRVCERLETSTRAQLVAVVTNLAEVVVQHIAVPPNLETSMIASMSFIDESFYNTKSSGGEKDWPIDPDWDLRVDKEQQNINLLPPFFQK